MIGGSPARAEETGCVPHFIANRTVHPRARGRDNASCVAAMRATGSPARARKRQRVMRRSYARHRFTRARAEETYPAI